VSDSGTSEANSQARRRDGVGKQVIECGMPNYGSLILGSAAIGALVSSVITFAGQALERKGRRKELLLSKAIDLAELQVASVQEIGRATGGTVSLYPYITYVRWYHRELQSLLKREKLSPVLEKQFEEFFAEDLNTADLGPRARQR